MSLRSNVKGWRRENIGKFGWVGPRGGGGGVVGEYGMNYTLYRNYSMFVVIF